MIKDVEESKNDSENNVIKIHSVFTWCSQFKSKKAYWTISNTVLYNPRLEIDEILIIGNTFMFFDMFILQQIDEFRHGRCHDVIRYVMSKIYFVTMPCRNNIKAIKVLHENYTIFTAYNFDCFDTK